MNIILVIALLLMAIFMGLIAYKLFEKRDDSLDNLLNPIKDSLEKFNIKIQDIEKSRIGAYEGLTQQVKSLLETQYVVRLLILLMLYVNLRFEVDGVKFNYNGWSN
jgi:uncharacterized protein involved in cysteine biosynthesis